MHAHLAGPKARFTLTTLEDRLAPALFGQSWIDGGSLSVSYAKDGADVAGVRSTLSATLSNQIPTASWQNEVARAFQTWSAAANLNFHFVSDAGDPFGADMPLQSGPRNGDIRIAARPLSDNVLAVTNPFDLLSGWSGEIVLNSNKKFSVGGSSNTHDLYSVVLHEIGHSLGLDQNATDSDSVMYETYCGKRSGLDSTDITAIRSLYGARANDAYEGTYGNDSRSRATAVAYMTSYSQLTSSSSPPYLVAGDLTRSSDVDSYKVTLPAGTTTLTAALKVDTISLLQGKVQLQDVSGNTIQTASATAVGQNLTVTASNLQDGGTYYIRVRAADDNGGFSTGEYKLIVGNSYAPNGFGYASWFKTSNGFSQYDKLSEGSVVDLGKARSATDGQWDVYGSTWMSKVGEIDTYKIATQSDTPPVMTVAVWSDGYSGLDPSVIVMDSTGKQLATTVLRNNNGSYILQLEGVKPNSSYTITVRADAMGWYSWLGATYWMGVDFQAQVVNMSELAQGTLSATKSVSASELTVTRSQLFRFELSAGTSTTATATTLSIVDTSGAVVKSVTVQTGKTATLDVLLAPGTYVVRIAAAATSSTSFSPLSVHLRFASLTDPIGPAALSPTASPTDANRSTGTSDTGYQFDALLASDPLMWWW